MFGDRSLTQRNPAILEMTQELGKGDGEGAIVAFQTKPLATIKLHH
jgi:hypothetical protein